MRQGVGQTERAARGRTQGSPRCRPSRWTGQIPAVTANYRAYPGAEIQRLLALKALNPALRKEEIDGELPGQMVQRRLAGAIGIVLQRRVTQAIDRSDIHHPRRVLGAGGGNLREYVNAAIKRQLFWDTVDAVQERNRDLSPEEAEALADEALDWARATRP